MMLKFVNIKSQLTQIKVRGIKLNKTIKIRDKNQFLSCTNKG